MTIQAQGICVCNSDKPHYCPPCLGENGFYACLPEDIAANVITLREERDTLIRQLHSAEALATKWGEDLDKLTMVANSLERNVVGIVGAYNIDLRTVMGNTNVAVLEHWCKEVRERIKEEK